MRNRKRTDRLNEAIEKGNQPKAIMCGLRRVGDGYEITNATLNGLDKTIIWQGCATKDDIEFWKQQTDISERVEAVRQQLLQEVTP